MSPGVRLLLTNLCALLAPPPRISVSEWCDRYRYLPPESGAEHGKWTTLSFQRAPLNAFSDPLVRQVVIKSATQMLKSEAILSCISWSICNDPGPILLLQPGDTDAKDFSKERVAPMIRDTPSLAEKFSDTSKAGFRNSDNTITEKLFPGGLLAIAGAGSARNLARRAIRYLFCDEVDKYKPTPEGNPLALARKRLATFRHRAKEIDTCSPTVAGSEIDKLYERSDKREFYVPCPDCGQFQSMMKRWGQVKWAQDKKLSREERALTARYHCEHCDSPWDDAKRWAAVDKGEWRGHAAFAGIAGFWISELYSPWKTLADIVTDFYAKRKDTGDFRTFVNTTLAENFEEAGECPEAEILYTRARLETYDRNTVPHSALFLTCGVDVQKTYISAEIVGWGRGKESWSIDERILDGNPMQPEVWGKLTALLNETFPHESGLEMPIALMAIDTGYATNEVYNYVRITGGRAIAVDGRQGGEVPVLHPSTVDVTVGGHKISNGIKLWPVGTGLLKRELYAWLMMVPPTEEELELGVLHPNGYCHFPAYEIDFFQQLTAERLITRFVKGYPKQEWHCQPGIPNHALDRRVYARAAAYVVGLDRFREQHWQEMERHVKDADQVMADRREAEEAAMGQLPADMRSSMTPAAAQPYYPQQRPLRREVRGRFL